MELILREGRPGDRPACVHIFAAVQPLTHPNRGGVRPPGADFEAVTRGEDLWVAESAGRVLGLIAIYHPARFIHHLYVDPGYLRRGIGRALLALGLRQCGGAADLKCDEANREAQAFYLAAGFRPVGWGWAPNGPWIRFRY
jgi:ribosomal protein S18 acetylase RimI-like enzyme